MQIINFLLEHKLVDQHNLMIFPTILGTGKKLFSNIDHQTNFKLSEMKSVGKDGITICVYESK